MEELDGGSKMQRKMSTKRPITLKLNERNNNFSSASYYKILQTPTLTLSKQREWGKLGTNLTVMGGLRKGKTRWRDLLGRKF